MFRDRSALLADNPRRAYFAAAALDLDGDSRLEAILWPSTVLKWGGDALYDVTPANLRLQDPPTPSKVLQVLDTPPATFKAEGADLNIYYAGVLLHTAPLLEEPLALLSADFDGDGRCEVFVLNPREANQLFAQRDGGWREVHCGPALLSGFVKRAALAADLDHDGHPELLVATLTSLHLFKATMVA
jgi:hypothetical protein